MEHSEYLRKYEEMHILRRMLDADNWMDRALELRFYRLRNELYSYEASV